MALPDQAWGTTRRFMSPVFCASLAVIACASQSRSQKEPPPVVVAAPRALSPSPAGAEPPADAGAASAHPELPRTVSLGAFPEGERIADLAAVSVEDRILLAWLTYFDEGAAGRRARPAPRSAGKASVEPPKQGASVMVRSLDKNADAFAPPFAISTKAVSIGSVALAPLSGPRHEVGLAWVGKENGVGQLFVTRLSPSGEKQAQRMITHSKVGCSDVALAASAAGFVAGYLETQDERAEIFAVKIGKDLAKIGVERRIAESRGEVSNLRIVGQGDEVLAVWSEARSEGEGGIFVARLLAADLSMRGDPVIIAPTARHALGLEVARVSDGVAIGWVEEAAPGPNGTFSPRSAFVAVVDSSQRGAPERVSALTADPSSIAIDCERICHVVLPGVERGELALYGFFFEPARKQETPARLASLAGVSTEDVSPVLLRDWLFFAEDNLRGRGRIRKVKLVW